MPAEIHDIAFAIRDLLEDADVLCFAVVDADYKPIGEMTIESVDVSDVGALVIGTPDAEFIVRIERRPYPEGNPAVPVGGGA